MLLSMAPTERQHPPSEAKWQSCAARGISTRGLTQANSGSCQRHRRHAFVTIAVCHSRCEAGRLESVMVCVQQPAKRNIFAGGCTRARLGSSDLAVVTQNTCAPI